MNSSHLTYISPSPVIVREAKVRSGKRPKKSSRVKRKHNKECLKRGKYTRNLVRQDYLRGTGNGEMIIISLFVGAK